MAYNIGSKETPMFRLNKDALLLFKRHGLHVAFGSQEIFIPEELLYAYQSFKRYHDALEDAELRMQERPTEVVKK